jgi:hypothetical protein
VHGGSYRRARRGSRARRRRAGSAADRVARSTAASHCASAVRRRGSPRTRGTRSARETRGSFREVRVNASHQLEDALPQRGVAPPPQAHRKQPNRPRIGRSQSSGPGQRGVVAGHHRDHDGRDSGANASFVARSPCPQPRIT